MPSPLPATTPTTPPTLSRPEATRPEFDARRLARACRIGFVVVLAVIAITQARAFLRLDFDPANPRWNDGYRPDFCDFWLAGKTLLQGENFYDVGRRWYVYPPMLAVLTAPLAMLSVSSAGAIWACLNTAFFGAGIWIGVKEMARRFAVPTWTPRWSAIIPAAALLVAAVMFDKGKAVVRLGQTDAMIVLACVLALRWMGRKPVWCGLALAFAANIKYQSLIFLPYLIIRGRWKEAATAAIGSVGLALSTSLIFGWERNLEYLGRAVSSLARLLGTQPPADASLQPIHPLTWHLSVSFPSVLGRLVEDGHAPQWLVLAGVGILAAMVFLVSWGIYRGAGLNLFVGRGGRHDDFTAQRRAMVGLEWVGLMVALAVFSPQTSARHLYIVLVPMCAAAVVIGSSPNGRRRWIAIGGVVLLACGLVLPPPGFARALEFWRYVGGASWCVVVMWWTLVWSGLQAARLLADREPRWTPQSHPDA